MNEQQPQQPAGRRLARREKHRQWQARDRASRNGPVPEAEWRAGEQKRKAAERRHER